MRRGSDDFDSEIIFIGQRTLHCGIQSQDEVESPTVAKMLLGDKKNWKTRWRIVCREDSCPTMVVWPMMVLKHRKDHDGDGKVVSKNLWKILIKDRCKNIGDEKRYHSLHRTGADPLFWKRCIGVHFHNMGNVSEDSTWRNRKASIDASIAAHTSRR